MDVEVQLDELLASDASDREKLDAIIEYCKSYIDTHIGTKHKERTEQGLRILEGMDYPRGDAYMNMAIAVNFWGEYKLKEMKPYIERALAMFDEQDDQLGLAITLSINIFRKLAVGDFTGAFQDGIRGVKIVEKENFESSGSWTFYMLGVMYFDIEDYQNALLYYTKALERFEKHNHDFAIGRTKSGIASCYIHLGKYDEAVPLLDEVIDYFQEHKNDEALSRAINDLGVLHRKKGELELSEKALAEAHEIRKTLTNKRGLNTTLLELAELMIEKGDYEEALHHLEEARELSKEHNAKPKLMRAHHLSYMASKAINDVPRAFEQLEKYLSLYSEVANAETTNKLKMQESSFATEKADQIAEIERQKNKEILDSINYAKRIQAAILPSARTVDDALPDSFVLYKPKDIVAGDFYWVETADDSVLFAACDCTGHGVPGAMVSVLCNNALNRSVREHGLRAPGEILDKTREMVIKEFEKSEEDVKDGMDIALCSLDGNKLSYAGANNPLWIIRKGANEVEEIRGDKQPIGKFEYAKPFTNHSVEVYPGDTIYTFSDGYADQFGGPRGKKFKAANLKKLLISLSTESMANQKKLIDKAFEEWRGDIEQLDDVCVIGLRL